MNSAGSAEELYRRLAERLGEGRVFRPGDRAYASTSELWNRAVTARPALVVWPRTAEEVAAAVTSARQAGVGVSVRGGGHDWAGRALRDGGLVIDLGEMRDVRVTGNTAAAGGGSRAADVVAAAAPDGLNVATGTSGAVGMAGLSLGGGYGPLLGTAGLAADNLLGAEVVLADGRLVSTEDDPELLWALRGGGGNFGVVTKMRIRLHPDRGLTGGHVLFPWKEAATVLARYAELTAAAGDGLTVLLEMAFVPEAGPCLLVVPVWSGDPEHADAAIGDVMRLGTAITSTAGATSQKDLLEEFDQHTPTGMHWDIHPRNLAELTPDLIDLLMGLAGARPGPGASIGLRQFRGAATRVGADDTAFGQRTAHVAVEIAAGRGPEADPRPYRKWADDVSAALAPHALPGGYPNFLGPDAGEQIAHAYGAHAVRLVAAKEHYDPEHVFTATPLPDRHLLGTLDPPRWGRR